MKVDLKRPSHLLAFGFGIGLAKFAPGTFGTIASLPFIYLLIKLPFLVQLGLVLLSFFIGSKICGSVANEMQSKDPSSIVWDEFVGMAITMLGVVLIMPIAIMPLMVSWPYWLLAFILFRFFDILKPWPISYLDKKVGGGLGIMVDDVLAGLFAALSFWFLWRLLGWSIN